MTSLSLRLAEHVGRVRYEDLPAATVAATKASLLDAIGVSLAASGLGEGVPAFVELARQIGGRPEATILGHGDKVAARDAALANGAMAHALDYEDAFDGAPLHPNAAVVPAALALAEAKGGVNGRELIAAVATGCDLVCRIGLCLTAPMEAHGWYPPPMFGAYGATAASGRLLGLTPAQMVDAFSLTLCQSVCSGELKSSPNSLIRAVREGFAAQAGVISAQLAKAGVVGFDLPFEGKAGFFALYARGAWDEGVLTAGLGTRFHGQDVSYKIWPSCRGTHAFIEAALAMRAEGAAAADIAAIHAEGIDLQRMLMEPAAQKQAPATAIDAKFSLPFCLGAAFVHGGIDLDGFGPAALADEAVLGVARKVTYAVVPGWGPERTASGRLTVRLADGRELVRVVEHARGHPLNPVSEADLRAKFLDCGARAARPLGRDALERLADRILDLETLSDVGALLA